MVPGMVLPTLNGFNLHWSQGTQRNGGPVEGGEAEMKTGWSGWGLSGNHRP